MRSVLGDVSCFLSNPFASFGNVQNFERTPPDKYVRWMNITHALVCCLSGSRVVCLFCMRLASCRYPVCCERSTTEQATEIPGRVAHAHSVIVQRQFCPFLILQIFALSIINVLHVR